jgi:hypothetical protein
MIEEKPPMLAKQSRNTPCYSFTPATILLEKRKKTQERGKYPTQGATEKKRESVSIKSELLKKFKGPIKNYRKSRVIIFDI